MKHYTLAKQKKQIGITFCCISY